MIRTYISLDGFFAVVERATGDHVRACSPVESRKHLRAFGWLPSGTRSQRRATARRRMQAARKAARVRA